MGRRVFKGVFKIVVVVIEVFKEVFKILALVIGVFKGVFRDSSNSYTL